MYQYAWYWYEPTYYHGHGYQSGIKNITKKNSSTVGGWKNCLTQAAASGGPELLKLAKSIGNATDPARELALTYFGAGTSALSRYCTDQTVPDRPIPWNSRLKTDQ